MADKETKDRKDRMTRTAIWIVVNDNGTPLKSYGREARAEEDAGLLKEASGAEYTVRELHWVP